MKTLTDQIIEYAEEMLNNTTGYIPPSKKVKLPKHKIHKTPRLLISDSYTISSDLFASQDAKEKSVYYMTFRRELNKINPDVYEKGDNRIVWVGLSRMLDYLFYDPITHEEIDEAMRFLEHAKVTMNGFEKMYCPEKLWRKVVDKYNGRPPLKITGMLEGSVVYPNEPCLMVENMDEDFEMGEIAAWFESSLLKLWSSSELVTQLAHWLEYCKSVVEAVYGKTKSEDEIHTLASMMLHSFTCRAGMTPQESEWLGHDFLYIFGGTDTFSGAYQAWKNSNESIGVFSSVYALAHRNVQGYENEDDCYNKMYDVANSGDIISEVNDCYSSYDTVERSHLLQALRSRDEGKNIVVVTRPDSGVPEEFILWLCKLAHKHGLSTVETIEEKEWRFGTFMKFLEGDGMTFAYMKKINTLMMEHGFPPFGWGVPYGQGGGGRNELKRDNLSAKFALCAVGKDYRPVCKFSDTLEKTTLPGPMKVLRSPEAIESKRTIVFDHEDGDGVMVPYFDGSDIWGPFKEGYEPGFNDIKARIKEQMNTMPKTMMDDTNHNYPASDLMKQVRVDILRKYAPKKLAQNYS